MSPSKHNSHIWVVINSRLVLPQPACLSVVLLIGNAYTLSDHTGLSLVENPGAEKG